MDIEINEKIKVGAVFENQLVKPRWFIWQNKKYQVKEITFTWKGKEGEAALLHFSVTDGANLYELCLNQKTLGWVLIKVNF